MKQQSATRAQGASMATDNAAGSPERSRRGPTKAKPDTGKGTTVRKSKGTVRTSERKRDPERTRAAILSPNLRSISVSGTWARKPR